MADDKNNNVLTKTLPRNNGAQATLFAVGGGYMIYMAYEIVRNTLNGTSDMSMTVTIITAIIMVICGIGILLYAWHLWKISKAEAAAKAEEARAAAQAEEEAIRAQALREVEEEEAAQ